MAQAESNANEVTALVAVYQAERSDMVATQAILVAVLGLAVAYAGVTAASIGQVPPKEISPWLVVALPLPLWLVALYLGTVSATISLRWLSGAMLERRLVVFANLSAATEVIGLNMTAHTTDFRRGGLAVKASLVLSFGGGILLVVGYTFLMLSIASSQNPNPALWWAPSVVYAAFIGLFIASWFSNEQQRTRIVQIVTSL